MQAERVFFPTIFKVKNRIPGNQMNQPEVLFEKKFVRFHRTFYSVRHIFTFMGLSTKFCHKKCIARAPT